MSNKLTKALEASFRVLLRPIAKFFVLSGFQYSQFMEIAKAEFIGAACDLSSAEDTTTSIAQRIGASRKDVSRSKDSEKIDIAKLAYQASIPAMVLTRWHQDLDFLQKDGVPKTICASAFESLVARIDNNLISKDILTELIESKAVQVNLDDSLSPRMRVFIPRSGDSLQILRFGMRVGDLAETLYRNSIGDRQDIEASAYNSHVMVKNLPLLRRVARTQVSGMLQSLDDWLTAHSDSNSCDSVRAGVGVYLFEDEPSIPKGPSKDSG